MDPNLLFRRQFILSTSSKFVFEKWCNFEIKPGIYLSVHPDLDFAQSSFGDIHLTLLGFAINPFEPLHSNQEVLDQLVQGAMGFQDVIMKTNHLGGRWAIVYEDSKSFNLFHDPGGQRQVYYCKMEGTIIVGSDPAIMNHYVHLEIDQDSALREFVDSSNFKKTQNSWIGSETIFKGVKHLLPNHFLDVLQLNSIRFWPNKILVKSDLDSVVEFSSEILVGSLSAISNRRKLVLAVTSGWDSRIILSASRSVQNEICYFVSVAENEKMNAPDIIIPLNLFKQLNIPFYVQKCGVEIEPEFKTVFVKNIQLARVDLTKAKYIYQYFLEFNGLLSVNGGMGEIARTCIRPRIPIKINGNNLVKLYCIDYDNLSYPIAKLDAWIQEVGDLCKENYINLFDILYWEQRIGNWGALYPAEEDIAMDQFCPFNNRLLLTTMMSVDEKYRRFPDYVLFGEIIKKLWPEVLSYPIGVCDFKLKTKNRIKHLVRLLSGVY